MVFNTLSFVERATVGGLLDLAVACGDKKEAADGGGAGGKGTGSKDGDLPKIMPYTVVQPRTTV